MQMMPLGELPDAGLFRRLAAATYDGLLILALWFTLGLIVAIIHALIRPPDITGPIEPLIAPAIAPLVILPLLWLIAAGFYSWFWLRGGQTLGMKTWRLRLISAAQRPLRLRDCLLRAAIGTLSWLLGLAGVLWLLFDRDHRTWHDRASQTRVVVLPRDNA